LIGWIEGEGADYGLHPLIHTSDPIESSTNCGSRFFRGKVWIKACNVKSYQKGGRVCLESWCTLAAWVWRSEI